MKIGLRTIVCAFALGIGFTGCGLLDPDESSAPEVTLSVPPILDAGTTTPINGEVKASEEISSVIFTVVTAQNESVSESQIQVEGPTVKGVKSFKFKDSNLKIKISSNTPSGDYKIKVTVKADVENDTYFPFTVEGGSTGPQEDILNEKTVTLGNQKAVPGSALDADNMQVYKTSEITSTATQAKIDVWFGVTGGNATMMSPSSANAAQFAPGEWTNKNSTQFKKVSVDFDDIKTQSDIDDLWTGSGESSIAVSAGDVFVIKTESGNRLLKIESASNETNGTVEVTGKIK